MVDSPGWAPLTNAQRKVALEVLLSGPMPRSELARRLDLSTASLTRLTKPLLDSGLLVEHGLRHDARVGRPTVPLDVDATRHHFVGVKLTGSHAYAVGTTIRAEPLCSAVREISDTSPSSVADLVAELVGELRTRLPAISALGVSVGGQVLADGTVASAPFLQWSGVPFGPLLSARTGLPVTVENDLVAWTEAEHWFGAGRGFDSFALLTIGAGVGYGLVIHGEQVRSPDSGTDVAGHIPLDPFGPFCELGHRGCATAMLSRDAMRASAAVGLGRVVSYDELLDLAMAGEAVATRVVADSGRALGRLVALVMNLTQARRIILSGEGIRLAHIAQEEVREGIAAGRPASAQPPDLVVDTSEFTEWARGAAVMAIQHHVLGEKRTECER